MYYYPKFIIIKVGVFAAGVLTDSAASAAYQIAERQFLTQPVYATCTRGLPDDNSPVSYDRALVRLAYANAHCEHD